MSNLYTKHSFYLAGQRGEKGETGDKGEQGERGFRGFQGEQGIQGISAYEVAVKEGFEGTEVEWIANLKGDKGDQGIQGIQGVQGVQGVKGDKGDKGDMGRGLEVIDIVDSVEDLPQDLTEENYGDCYMVGENLYMFGSSGWTNLGAVTTKFIDEYTSMGKAIIADAITSKGVNTSPDDTFPEMGFNIKQIYQNRPIVDGSDAIMENTNKVLYDVKKFRSEITQFKEPKLKETHTSTTGNFVDIKETKDYRFLLSERLLLRLTNDGEMLSVGYVFAKQMALDTSTPRIGIIYGLGEGNEGGKVRIMSQEMDGTKHTLDLSKTPIGVKFNSKGQLLVASLNEITIYNTDYTVANTILVDDGIDQMLLRSDDLIVISQKNGHVVKILDNSGKMLFIHEFEESFNFEKITYILNDYGQIYCYANKTDDTLLIFKINITGEKPYDIIYNETNKAKQVIVSPNNIFYLYNKVDGIIDKITGEGKEISKTIVGTDKGGDILYGYLKESGKYILFTSNQDKAYEYLDEFEVAWELDIEGIDGTITNVSDDKPVGPTIPEGMEGVAVFKDDSQVGIKNVTYMQKLLQEKPTYKDVSKTLPIAFIDTLNRIPQDSEGNCYCSTGSDAPQQKLIKLSPTLDLIKSIDLTGLSKIDKISVCRDRLYVLRDSRIHKYDLDLNLIKDVGVGTTNNYINAKEVETETGDNRVIIISTLLGGSTKIIRIYDDNLELIYTYSMPLALKSIGIGKDSHIYTVDTNNINKFKFTDDNKIVEVNKLAYTTSGSFDVDIQVFDGFIMHRISSYMNYINIDLSEYRTWQLSPGVNTYINNYICFDSGILYCVSEKSIYKTNIMGTIYWQAPFTIGNKLLNIIRNGKELRSIAESYSYALVDEEMEGIKVAVLE